MPRRRVKISNTVLPKYRFQKDTNLSLQEMQPRVISLPIHIRLIEQQRVRKQIIRAVQIQEWKPMYDSIHYQLSFPYLRLHSLEEDL